MGNCHKKDIISVFQDPVPILIANESIDITDEYIHILRLENSE